MGQRIVGVNGVLVYPNTPHKEVVAQIKRSPLCTTLLVASENVDKWYKENNAEYSFDYIEDDNLRNKQISPHSIHISDDEEILQHQHGLQRQSNEEVECIEIEEIHEPGDFQHEHKIALSQQESQRHHVNHVPTCGLNRKDNEQSSSSSILNGFETSVDGGSRTIDNCDIFGLSAQEAREKLRLNKKDIHRGFDMSLEEKFRLVSNM
ncbi:hypothetical protein DICVIV_05954 [Dictyocaulus viviparus]|uniref:PDZ domain-containing protein n=1 Tax=Dictyocaulus viviparus TaxID=29172 RepID=A0A0D8XVX6_DICVI|nr:hypothetical protein DICVIV_05954 [Dictyocaulus viviparus]